MTTLWREKQRKNFTDWKKLLPFLELDMPGLHHTPRFPLNLPIRLAEKILKNTPDDPILLQFLPSNEETQTSPLFVLDPVGDTFFRKAPKLLHKYQGRALLLCSSACAMHCRYCFRQNFDYTSSDKSFEQELQLIREDRSLTEIILSGGDPLSLGHTELSQLVHALDQIPHIKRIRFHTRFPIGIPERIDSDFLTLLEKTRTQIIFIIHSNHPNEWDDDIFSALKHIQRLAIPVLCQTVLLKGINDHVTTLYNLFSLLADRGILPYYLHQLDPVEGSMHFEVSEQQGLQLIDELRSMLSGYALPQYVRETAGQTSKTQISHPLESLQS